YVARLHTFCIRRRPPSSPLFPYTTLFRSLAARAEDDTESRAGRGRAARDRRSGHPLQGSHRRADGAARSRHGGGGRHDAIEMPLDRKSTRLNSSHVKISYAVFCLKKKKLP